MLALDDDKDSPNNKVGFFGLLPASATAPGLDRGRCFFELGADEEEDDEAADEDDDEEDGAPLYMAASASSSASVDFEFPSLALLNATAALIISEFGGA